MILIALDEDSAYSSSKSSATLALPIEQIMTFPSLAIWSISCSFYLKKLEILLNLRHYRTQPQRLVSNSTFANFPF